MKTSKSNRKFLIAVLSSLVFTLLFSNSIMAQEKTQMVRFAKLKIDPSQLEKYNTALKEQMNTAIRLEPGVLSYTAVADKNNPTDITILEIYADTDAYQSHIETLHFKKYKETVKNMVQSLELIDLSLIGSAKKEGM